MRRLDGNAADMFQKSQRLWAELAEADCHTEGEPASAVQGAGYAYVYEFRMAERYGQRLKRAEKLLSDWQPARNIRP